MKEKFITFRATIDETNLLSIMSKRENRNQSEMLRELIREGGRNRGLAEVGLIEVFGDRSVMENEASRQ